MIKSLVLFQICSLKEEIRINTDGSPTIVYQQGCERVEVINLPSLSHYYIIRNLKSIGIRSRDDTGYIYRTSRNFSKDLIFAFNISEGFQLTRIEYI